MLVCVVLIVTSRLNNLMMLSLGTLIMKAVFSVLRLHCEGERSWLAQSEGLIDN